MEAITARVREIFALWQEGRCPGGQIYVVKDGQTIVNESLGYADLERQVPNTEDTIFHVASVSKQITCMSALMLWEQGKLDVTADIRAYIPDLIAFEEPVTVLDIMHNISGIRDQWNLQMLAGVRMGDIITQADLLALNARQRSLNFPPRTEYFYSNTNFVFVAEIIHRISGLTLPRFAKKYIFEPLGMSQTFIRETYTDMVENRALSYEWAPEGFKWVPLNFSNWGATSLHTTAKDFSAWLAHFMNPTLCKPETIAKMCEVPKLIDDAKSVYACGVMCDSYKGHRRITHDGADAGYRASAHCFPDDNLTVMVTANVPNLILAEQVGKVVDAVLGLPETAPADALYDAAVAAPVPGGYFIPAFMTLVGIEVNDAGAVAILDGVCHRLIHEGGNRYLIDGLPARIYFRDGKPWMNPALPTELLPHAPAVFGPEQQTQLAGTYYSDELQALYTLEIDGDGLALSHWRMGRGRLVALPDGTFVAPLERHLKLKLDAERGTLTLLGERVRAVTLEKVEIQRV